MGHGNRHSLSHGGMAVEGVLDLLGGDVLAAADDQILLPAGDEDGGLGTDEADIAHPEEAVGGDSGSGLCGIRITDEEGGAARQDLALGSGCDLAVTVVDDANLVIDDLPSVSAARASVPGATKPSVIIGASVEP